MQHNSELPERFMATLAHDLRASISNIEGFTQLLLRGDVGHVTPEQAEFLNIIHRNALSMDHLLDSYSRLLAAHQRQLTRIPVDAVAAWQTAESRIESTRWHKRHSLSFQLPTVLLVHADPNALADSFEELLELTQARVPENGRILIQGQRTPQQAAFAINTPNHPQPPLRRPTITAAETLIQRMGGQLTWQNNTDTLFNITLPTLT